MLVIWEKIISFPSLRGLPYSFIPMQYLFPFCLCCSWFAWRQALSWPWICSAQGAWGCPRSLGPRTSYSYRDSPHEYEQSECLGSQPLFPWSCHWLFPVSGTGHESWFLFHDIASSCELSHSCELSPPLLRVRACPGLCCDYCVSENMPWLLHSCFSNPCGFFCFPVEVRAAAHAWLLPQWPTLSCVGWILWWWEGCSQALGLSLMMQMWHGHR